MNQLLKWFGLTLVFLITYNILNLIVLMSFEALLGLRYINFALPIAHVIDAIIVLFIYRKYGRPTLLGSNNLISIWDIFLLLIISASVVVIKDPILNLYEILGIKELPKNTSNQVLDVYQLGYAFYTILLIPIIEELFFRGIMLEEFFKKNLGLKKSILFSSFLFSLIHFNPIELEISFFYALSNFVFGLIAGIIYCYRRNVLPVIFFHIMVNLIASVIKLYYGSYVATLSSLNFNIIYWGLFLVSFLVLLIMLYLFAIKGSNSEKAIN
ncbi:CPBP family intramembrane glutamic endopeptidase [Flagellimonas sp. 2504JD1-5]